MTDLRTRALAALSGACWPDNEAREETIKRMESALRDARAAGIREAAGECLRFGTEFADMEAKFEMSETKAAAATGYKVCSGLKAAILALIEKE